MNSLGSGQGPVNSVYNPSGARLLATMAVSFDSGYAKLWEDEARYVYTVLNVQGTLPSLSETNVTT
jgi:hypothetical protein